MIHGISAFIPLIILIAGALWTKRIAEPMFAASVAAALILHGKNFFSGYIDMMYDAMSNPSYQFVLIILFGFGAMIKLFQESGGIQGFGRLLEGHIRGTGKSLLLAWFMSLGFFVDEYLGTLTVPFTMRELTDCSRVPREHLAFQSNVMAVCACVLVPFSSWTGFTVGLLSDQGATYKDYIAALPFMFYPLLISAVCLLLAAGLIPKIGPLKKAYERVKNNGPLAINEKAENSIIDIEMPENTMPSSALNVAVPLVCLVAVTIYFDNDIAHGILATLALQAVMYVGQKIMTPGRFVHYFFEGAKSMTSLAITICFAFMISTANQMLGLFDILIGGIGTSVPAWLLPLLVFITVGFTTFATGGYWLTQVIAIPIFVPMAPVMGVSLPVVIGAIMSGVTLGCSLCFYSEPIFMTSAGTGTGNFRIVAATLPYAAVCMVLSAGMYVAAGLAV